MICWIASYPKSGNTFCRILLSEYLYGDLNQPFNFSGLDQIKQFPNLYYYNPLLDNGICKLKDLAKHENVIKYSIYLQKQNFSKDLFFLKTHSSFFQKNEYSFTDNSITSCAIYLVRDPRNVLLSYSEYLNETLEQTYHKMNSENYVYQKYKDVWYPVYKIDSWINNYETWKKAQLNIPIKIIKYEDLVINTEEILLEILLFLKKYITIDLKVDRIKKVIQRATFSKLQELETKGLFNEMNDLSTSGVFFKKGKERNWKSDEKNNLIEKITENWKEKIISLQY